MRVISTEHVFLLVLLRGSEAYKCCSEIFLYCVIVSLAYGAISKKMSRMQNWLSDFNLGRLVIVMCDVFVVGNGAFILVFGLCVVTNGIRC